MSKVALVAAGLVVVAGAIVFVLAYRTPTTGDGQEAIVRPFVVFWTVLGVAVVWGVDRTIRAIRRYFAKPS
jgi:hypothetical protein